MNPLNPYQSPTAGLDSDAELVSASNIRDKSNRVTFQRLVRWPLIYAANMILPAILGFVVTNDAGFVGMTVASIFMLVIGWFLTWRYSQLSMCMFVGGVFVAISQLVPFLHFIVGVIAIGIATRVGMIGDSLDEPIGDQEVNSVLSGFFVTMFTGGSLMLIAFMIGWFAIAAWSVARGKPVLSPFATDSSKLPADPQ